MADTPVYITLDSLKASLSVAGSFADDDLRQQIKTASRVVDTLAGRRFYRLDDADTDRYYTPLRPVVLEIDDLLSLTALASDQDGDGVFETSWVLHQDFELQPDNADTDGRPWERVILKQRSRTVFPAGLPRSVKVTGRFGWAAVPDQVQTFTQILASRLLQRARMAPFGVVSLGVEGASRIAKEDPDLCMLLRDFDRSPIFAG